MKILKNRSGFTLVEVLIATGLISGLALAISSVLSTGTKGSKKISQDLEIASLTSAALGSLRDPKSCQESLHGMDFGQAASATPAGGVTIPSIFKVSAGPAIPILAVGGAYATGTISSVKIPADGIKVYAYDSVAAIAKVQITFARTGITSGNVNTTRDFTIFLTDFPTVGGTFDKATDSCYAGDNPFNCADLGGDEDPLTKVCRSLNLYEATPNTTAASATTLLERALTVNGDLVIAADGAESNPELYVNGTTTTTGDTITGGSFVLAPSQMLRLSAIGSMEIVAGIGSGLGANIELQTANAMIDADVTTFRNRAGVAGTAVGISGNLTVTGNDTVTGNQTTGGNSTITGNQAVNGTLSVGGTASFNAGVVATDGGGFLLLNKTANDIGGDTSNPNRVVTKEWVQNFLNGSLSAQLSAAQKADIVSYILANSGATSYIAIRDSITDYALGQINLAGSSTCPAGQFMNRVVYNASLGRFTYTCATVTDDCTVNGNCDALYANNRVGADRFCVRRPAPKNWSCISSGGTAFWGACYFASELGRGPQGSYPRTFWRCPNNYFSIGSRNQSAGAYNQDRPAEPFCCPVQLVE